MIGHTIKPGTPEQELRNTEHWNTGGKPEHWRNNGILAEHSEYHGIVENVQSSGTT